jgi:site-specific DNA recombinase
VQAKLGTSANDRQLKLRASPSILAGRIFDDGGNRMTPTHTNKQGARYRYYVSHAVLQKRDDKTGSVVRVSAPDIETTVVEAARNRLKKRFFQCWAWNCIRYLSIG